MLGENIMMAPVFSASVINDDNRDVYLPGSGLVWTELWTGVQYEVPSGEQGIWLNDVSCPIGSPPVFYRDTSVYSLSTVLAQF